MQFKAVETMLPFSLIHRHTLDSLRCRSPVCISRAREVTKAREDRRERMGDKYFWTGEEQKQEGR